MNAPTHIVGGFVLAGTLCSFTDVNIFSNHEYIIACTVFSLLPDIDSTKSLIGKSFYPIAWILNRKFGHRTITHSLLFLLIVFLVLFSLYLFRYLPNTDLIKISIFSLISHYVFDMITVSGIPLLYPWFKNACVIPGNVNFRFKSGDFKSEFMVSAVCGLLCFSLQPLFAQGFWTTYNRAFGTIRHVDRENKNTEYYVVCDYDYILNSANHIGSAIVIESKQNELTLFDNERVFVLNADDPQLKVNFTKPRISNISKRFEELQFFNIGFDSLSFLLHNRLASGLIQSSVNVRYVDNAVTYFTNFIRFNNRFNFSITADLDTTKTTIRANIAKLEASINQSYSKFNSEKKKYISHFNRISELEKLLIDTKLSNYERNKLQQELISLRRKSFDEPVYSPPSSQLAELEVLRNSLTNKPLLFSGHLTVYTFGYSSTSSTSSPHDADDADDGEPTLHPLYAADHLLASVRDSTSLY